MKQKSYPGSNLIIEKTLNSGSNYNRYLTSYQSEGLKQYALLTVPIGKKPNNSWPVILLNHGYVPPKQYSTENSYTSFIDPLASAGYIVFKPDYRGNGNSQGIPTQIYASPDYLTDSMNALASVKRYKDANQQKIGVFGHSMGGNITLHELVISKDIKAAEIIAGVVGDETSILAWWNQRIKAKSINGNDLEASYAVQQMINDHGTPSNNPDYWNAIDPTKYLKDVTMPIQIQVGTADTTVPPNFSSSFKDELQRLGKTVDYREYIGADHNLYPDTSTALKEVVAFFDKYLK
jgi:dipeptidyl aminopeptidase/acylaminoacyl peptidase